MQSPLAGLWPPASTPFTADGAIDEKRLISHCRGMLDDGAAGLAVLGTTSEANSLTLDERRRVIDALVEDGVAPEQLLPGTGACAIDDAVALTRHVGEIGGAGVLLLPPFYYKNVSDDGLFAFVAAVIERSGPKVPRIMLYHFPAMAAVGWSIDACRPIAGRVSRRHRRHEGFLRRRGPYQGGDRRLSRTSPCFPGAELYLLDALKWGARGCISATANVNARAIASLIADRDAADAPARQAALIAVRKSFADFPTVAAVKTIKAAITGDESWLTVRPPLVPLKRRGTADAARPAGDRRAAEGCGRIAEL